MNKSNLSRIKRAKKHFAKIRKLVSQRPSPFEKLTEEEAIEKMRATREEIWGKKIALTFPISTQRLTFQSSFRI